MGAHISISLFATVNRCNIYRKIIRQNLKNKHQNTKVEKEYMEE